MSATALAFTQKQKSKLKKKFFNAIKDNNAVELAALIPELNASHIGLNVDLQAFYPKGTLDIIKPIYPISIAIFYNALDVLRLLIDSGANINIVETFYEDTNDDDYDNDDDDDDNDDDDDDYGRPDKKVFTPLLYAEYFRRGAAADMLIQAGAKNTRARRGGGARAAFKPANIPNITGRTGKNYKKIKKTQRRRATEARHRQAKLKRTRRRTLKATKPL